jgi:hypothetical protein
MNNSKLLTNHRDTAHKYLKRLKKAIKRTPTNMFMSEDREALKSFMLDKENAWVFDDVYASEDFLSLYGIGTDEEEENCE